MHKTIKDIKDYVKSLDTIDNKIYHDNEFIILSCFTKCLEIIESNLEKEKQQIVLGRSGLACGICVVDCVNSLR